MHWAQMPGTFSHRSGKRLWNVTCMRKQWVLLCEWKKRSRTEKYCVCRIYIDTEIYSPENQAPPLGEGFALSVIRAKARNYRQGTLAPGTSREVLTCASCRA